MNRVEGFLHMLPNLAGALFLMLGAYIWLNWDKPFFLGVFVAFVFIEIVLLREAYLSFLVMIQKKSFF